MQSYLCSIALRQRKRRARSKQADILSSRGLFFVLRWRPPFPLLKRRFCRGEMSPCSTEPGSCSSCKGSSGQACIQGGRCSNFTYRGAGRRTPADEHKYGHGTDPFVGHRDIVSRLLPMELMAGQQRYLGQPLVASSKARLDRASVTLEILLRYVQIIELYCCQRTRYIVPWGGDRGAMFDPTVILLCSTFRSHLEGRWSIPHVN